MDEKKTDEKQQDAPKKIDVVEQSQPDVDEDGDVTSFNSDEPTEQPSPAGFIDKKDVVETDSMSIDETGTSKAETEKAQPTGSEKPSSVIDKKPKSSQPSTSTTPRPTPKPEPSAHPSAKTATSRGSSMRRHGLSTGILIVWFIAVAVICLIIGAFGGATWQRGNDERAFDVERSALNDKIETLQSQAEEDQQELAELREFRKKLEDLVTEYMELDAKSSQNADDAATTTGGEDGATSDVNSNSNVNANANSSTSANENKKSTSFFDLIFGGGSSENENSNANENENENAGENIGGNSTK